MDEVFRYKKSYYVTNVVWMAILFVLGIFFFWGSTEYHRGTSTLLIVIGFFFLILAVVIGITIVRGLSFFISVTEKGININDKHVIHWDNIENFDVEEEGEKTPEKFTIFYRDTERIRRVKGSIPSSIEGYEYLKSIVKKHYQENVLRNIDGQMKKKEKGKQ